MIEKIRFVRRATCIADVSDAKKAGSLERFKIVKIIEITQNCYKDFARNLLWDTQFIRDHSDLMGYNDERNLRYCILVKCDDTSEGLLVDSHGHGFALYAALIEDCNHLDLEGIPRVAYSDERAKIPVHVSRGLKE